MQKTISIKMLAVFMTMVLVIGCVVGGTVAWLIAETDDVVNTFTFGNIKIVLDETKVDIEGNPLDKDGNPVTDIKDAERITGGADKQNSYKLLPGASYLKDPKVTVEAKSEKCWLFVTVKENIAFDDGKNGTFDEFIKYEVDDKVWTELKTEADGTKVYYRLVDYSEDSNQVFDVLMSDSMGKQVTVDANLTDERIADLADEPKPTLTFRAYAVQYSGFEPKDGETDETAALNAWNQAYKEANPTP